jgi:nucleoid-associated protein YgaU
MPNDAKLGLIVGVGLVIAVAVVFFRKEGGPPEPLGAATAGLAPKTAAPVLPLGGAHRPVPAENAARTAPAGQRHTVQEGETLSSLAQRYYGDREKYAEIYRVNREVVKDADSLTPGTVLTIPDLPADAGKAADHP